MIFTMLTVSGEPARSNITPDERFRRNVQQLGGFLLVGFALLSLHLLREQIVTAAVIKNATVVTESGNVVQDPRKVPEQLQIRRGAIYAGGKTVAASEVITPSRYMHRIYPEPDLSYLAGYYNPTIYGSAGLEASFDDYLSGSKALDPLLEQQRILLNRPTIGNDLYLTVDPALQTLAQQTLASERARSCCSTPRAARYWLSLRGRISTRSSFPSTPTCTTGARRTSASSTITPGAQRHE